MYSKRKLNNIRKLSYLFSFFNFSENANHQTPNTKTSIDQNNCKMSAYTVKNISKI